MTYELKIFDFMMKFFSKLLIDVFVSYLQGDEMTTINGGYATLEGDGIYVEELSGIPEAHRYQLYHYLILDFAGIDNMNGKQVLETGCGIGGGLNNICRKLQPHKAVGCDISPQCVILK
jgi:spermidine synthase